MAEQKRSNCAIPLFMNRNDSNLRRLRTNNVELSIPSLKDKYVTIIHNAFNEQECKELIAFSENIGYKDALVNLGFGHQQTMTEFRNHKKLSIDNTEIANYIFHRIKSSLPTQFDNRKIVDVNKRLRFLRYSPKQYFGPHYDGMYMRNNGQRSLITVLIYLNDNYNGGEIKFLHPTKQHKTHSIKPQTGMVVLFEQKELFHEGSVILDQNTNEDVFKYCIRSDIMYSSQVIDESKSNSDKTFNSYEIEKQTVYFQRKQSAAVKSTSSQPKSGKMNKLFEENLTMKVINFWFIELFAFKNEKRTLPIDLFEEIAKYCRILGVLDYICDPNELQTLAQVSESCERYEDMIELMTELVKLKSRTVTCTHTSDEKHTAKCDILTVDQRNLFSVAFKNVVGAKRASWRTIKGEISSLNAEEKVVSDIDDETKKMKLYVCKEYLRVIERELHQTCLNILDLLETYIVKKIENCSTPDFEAFVFYLKMTGDYWRYLAEIFDTSPMYKDNASKYYSRAYKIGTEELKACHPTLLGLSLNYAVHLYEIANDAKQARHIARISFDNAIEQLDTMQDDEYKDSTLVMRLLRDNLTLWSSESENNNND